MSKLERVRVDLAPCFAVVDDDLSVEEIYAVHHCHLEDEPELEEGDAPGPPVSSGAVAAA